MVMKKGRGGARRGKPSHNHSQLPAPSEVAEAPGRAPQHLRLAWAPACQETEFHMDFFFFSYQFIKIYPIPTKDTQV